MSGSRAHAAGQVCSAWNRVDGRDIQSVSIVDALHTNEGYRGVRRTLIAACQDLTIIADRQGFAPPQGNSILINGVVSGRSTAAAAFDLPVPKLTTGHYELYQPRHPRSNGTLLAPGPRRDPSAGREAGPTPRAQRRLARHVPGLGRPAPVRPRRGGRYRGVGSFRAARGAAHHGAAIFAHHQH